MAFDLDTHGRLSAQDIATASDNPSPTGLWSDGVTLWASDYGGGVYAYRLADGARVPGEDIAVALEEAGNDAPTGLWSDGTTLWVADYFDAHVYAYGLADKARDKAREFALEDGTKAFGLWSDGTTVWTADFADGRVEAYGLANGRFDTSRGYNTSTVGNSAPVSLWSDGETLWVGDRYDEKLYAYAMSVLDVAVLSANATLSALSLSGVEVGSFASGTTSYSATVANMVATTPVTATPTHAAATVAIADPDGSTAGASRTVNLDVGDTAITVTVTAEDGQTTQTYTVTVTRAMPSSSNDATLEALALSGLDIGTFDAATTHYAATAAESVAATTVTATPNDTGASVVIADADGSTSGTARAVALDYGSNTITATVTAADGETTRAYTATVTRAYTLPTATIAAGTSPVTEGAAVSFTVHLDKAAKDALTVAVSVAETGDALSGTASSVTMAVGTTEATLTLGTADDRVVEAASAVTATLGAGADAGYTVGATDSAEVSVADNDTATFAVTASPAGIDEGDAATVTVSITNGVTFAADQALTLTGSGTASADDYTLDATSPTLAVGEAAVSATLTATDDEAEEAAETVTVTASHGGATVGSATVIIAASDTALSDDAALSALSLSGVDIGTFDAATTAYTATVDDDLTTTTVTATANDAGASVTIADADGSTTDTPRTVSLAVGDNAITVAVTAADGETTATYTVTVTRGGGALTAAFEDVPVEHYGSLEFELGLRFSEDFPLSYRTVQRAVKVDAGVLRRVRRTLPGSNLRWRIRVRPETVRDVTVTLPGARPCAAANAICTANGRALSNSPTVTLPGPDFRISADAGSVSEGTPAAFTVSRTGAAALAMEVSLQVTESGTVLPDAPPRSVTFGRGENSVALRLETDDDAVSETDSTVTATLDIRPARMSAAVTVLDDDEATFALSAVPTEIEEGATSTVTVSIDNGVTFAKKQTLSLSATGTASVGDYSLKPMTLTLAAGASAVAAMLTATDDAAREEDETVIVSARLGEATLGETTVTIGANDTLASDDATLTALSLSGVDIGAFDSATTEYTGSVGHDVTSTTVVATPNDGGADVLITDANGATSGSTRTTRLAEGTNGITAKVTAEDRVATRTYAVTVTRDPVPSVGWGERRPGRDIDLSAADRPRGLWSDGQTLWTSDWDNGTVLAYALADGSRAPSKDFALGLFPASALWSDGDTLWAADYGGGVYAYRLSDGERLADEDLDGDEMAEAGNDAPAGLWSDGDTMWVADYGDGFVYAYGLSDGARRDGKEFTLRAVADDDVTHIFPFGLTSDGETVLATDWARGTVRGYSIGSGARRAELDIDETTTANAYAAGVWSDGETLWVVDELEHKALAYAATELREPVDMAKSLLGDLKSRAAAVPAGAATGPPVSIPDAGLRARIAATLGKAEADAIGVHEIEALVVLDARGAGVTDLTGLGHAVNLEGLDLGRNPVADLRPLSSLPVLRRLNLDAAAVDLWELAPLRQLTGLSLRDSGLTDVSALTLLRGLRMLDLAGNRLEHLTAVGALTDLRALDVGDNTQTDLSPLTRLGDLRELYVRGNRIEDLSALVGREGLRIHRAVDGEPE